MKLKSMIAAACSLLALATGSAQAATFSVDKGDHNRKLNFITITGRIEYGDNNKLLKILKNDKTLAGDDTVVMLASRGGNVDAGVKMGLMIRARELRTYVPNDEVCASICAAMWLAGKTKLAGETSEIGFHAPFFAIRATNGDLKAAKTSPWGMAFMAKYYDELGLDRATAKFLLSTPSADIYWLTIADAEKMGIKFDVYADKKEALTPVATAPVPAQGFD